MLRNSLVLLLAVLCLTAAPASPMQTGSSVTNSLYEQGRLAYSQANYHQALRAFQQVVQQNPSNATAYFRMGLTHSKLKQYTQAQQAFQKTLSLAGSNKELKQKAEENLNYLQTIQKTGQKTGTTKTGAAAESHSPSGSYSTLGKVSPSSAGTYLSHVLAGGKVVHWNVATMPLKVYVHPPTGLPEWGSSHQSSVQVAMQAWKAASRGRIYFTTVTDPKQADIRVVWKSSLNQNRLGVSPMRMTDNRILQADVVLTTRLPDGITQLNQAQINNTAIHEFGHALGLQGHSPNPQDIMYASANPAQQTQLSAADVATINALYSQTADVSNVAGVSVAAARKAQQALEAGHNEFRKGAFAQALSWADSGLKAEPSNADLLALKGACYQNQGNKNAALAAYKAALKANPSHSDARRNLSALGG